MDVPLQDDHQDEISSDSRALVPVPAKNMNALSIVPIQKPKRPEHSQRRIRRPFSVSEVEALVQAVEMLGTGRWRDVKIRAFDNANHRTYVDLKVHYIFTSISKIETHWLSTIIPSIQCFELTGQMEDIGAHGEDNTSTEERGTGPAGTP